MYEFQKVDVVLRTLSQEISLPIGMFLASNVFGVLL